MKAIICTATGQVEIFTFTESWTACPCGNVRARWLNSRAGTMVADACDRDKVRFPGMDNRLLIPVLTGIGHGSWETFRACHEACTNAPGYIFDKSRAGCWAAIAVIGSTTDTRWATAEESAEARAS